MNLSRISDRLSSQYWLIITISAITAITLEFTGRTDLFALAKAGTTVLILLPAIAALRTRAGFNLGMLLIGLLACLAGDIYLLEDSRFVQGLTAFAFAHVFFVVLFIRLGGWPVSLVSTTGIALISVLFWWVLQPALGNLLMPVTIYVVLIAVMASTAGALYVNRPSGSSRLLLIGALIFMFSDSSIAVNRFLMPFEWAPAIILGSYWIALCCITSGALKMLDHASE